MAHYEFIMDDRLGIPIPHLHLEWDEYNASERIEILYHWEQIRGKIPNRIYDLEQSIRTKQCQLFDEENFNLSCKLNAEIADLASCINDLHLWFRVNQDVTSNKSHG